MKLTRLTNKYWYLIFAYFLITSVSNGCMVYAGYQLSSVLNNVFEKNIQGVTKDTIIVAISFLLSIISNYISNILKIYTVKKIKIELKNLICRKIISFSDQEYNSYKKGELISWFTNDVNSIENLCIENLFNVIKSLSAIILATYAIFTFHWIIGLSLLGITILMIVLPTLVQSIVTKKTEKMSKEREIFSSKVENLLNGYIIFSYANEKRKFANLINIANKREEKAVASYQYVNAFQGLILFSLFISSQMIMLFVSIFLSLNNYTEVGSILAVTNISGTFFNGLNGLFGSAFIIKAGTIIIKKFNYNEKQVHPKKFIAFEKLEVKNLSYKVAEKDIFKNINLTFEKNKKYLIVGDSGKGKTTLLNIIFGLIDNYQGNLIINEKHNYKSLSKEDIKNLIWYMPQKTIIFNDSLRNNISLFDPSIEDEKLFKALENVNLNELANSASLESDLNNDFSNLSGGELQRISIARSLTQNKQILIFDEITSNLDKGNREIIENIIGGLKKTIIFISHTTNILNNQNFDEIIKL